MKLIRWVLVPCLPRSAWVSLAAAALCMASAAGQGAKHDLGTLGGTYTSARDVSDDGSVVVGISQTASGEYHAFRWEATTGMQDLGTLGGTGSWAHGVNADGSVVVGASKTGNGGISHAFRWELGTGMTDIDTFNGTWSAGYDVSADGSVVVGRAQTPAGQNVFRWTAVTGMQDLGFPASSFSDDAALSGDGTVVAGGSNGQVVRWTATTGTQPIGVAGRPFGVNHDGSVIVGSQDFGGGYQAFRWSEVTGVQTLGILPGAKKSFALDVNADGSVVIGSSEGVYPEERPFRWTALGGMQDLGAVLGAINTRAYAVNADGSVVVGLSYPTGYLWTSTEIGTRYCTPSPNSTGRSSLLNLLGNADVTGNNVTLTAEFLPQHSFGYFLGSRYRGGPLVIAGSQGPLCLGGFIGRFIGAGGIVNSGPTGTLSVVIDIDAIPTPFGPVAVQPGETWCFQAWHRDLNPTPTSNFTDAISVTFR